MNTFVFEGIKEIQVEEFTVAIKTIYLKFDLSIYLGNNKLNNIKINLI